MIWIKLKNLMKDLNTKHSSITFDFKYSKDKIEILDAQVYIEQHHCK